MKVKSNIDIIKLKYLEVKDRPNFHKAVAAEFGLKASSVRINWFTRFEVIEKYKVQESLIVFMDEYLDKLNKK